MVAKVAVTLADAGIGIQNMALGKSPDAPTALMLIATYGPVPDAVVTMLRSEDGILDVAAVAD
jgi:predicted regulator of amino acid metabolism with ACT domain